MVRKAEIQCETIFQILTISLFFGGGGIQGERNERILSLKLWRDVLIDLNVRFSEDS